VPTTDLADPSAGDWVAASLAAALVVVLLALLLVAPALRRSSASPWGRVAGLLLAATAAVLVLVVVVAGTAALVSRPDGVLATELVHAEVISAERIAVYTAALLLPLAAVLGVLAVAVVDIGRPSAFRPAAGAVAGLVLVAAGILVVGDAGDAVTAAALSAAVLSGGAAFALMADELGGRRHSSSPTSDSSTMSSQRSLQSRQR
jgi:hypothetical protein